MTAPMSPDLIARTRRRQRRIGVLTGLVALTIRVTFATLAAVQLIGTGLIIRTAVVAVLITIATGAATRVDRALR
jgi:hypothetical protein